MAKDQPDEGERLYQPIANELRRRQTSNSEHYDKSILTMSSSTLAFTIFVIKYLVDWDCASNKNLLFISWGTLFLSILTSLIAYKVGNNAIRNNLTKIRDYYLGGDKEALNRTDCLAKLNNYLNYATGGLFIVSLALVLVFIWLNIK